MDARLLDGRTSNEMRVALSFGTKGIFIKTPSAEFTVPFSDLRVQERFKSTARRVRLPKGEELIIPVEQDERFMRILRQAGAAGQGSVYKPHSFGKSLLYLVLILVLGFLAYSFALPPFSRMIAQRLPGAILDPLGKEVLETLDSWVLAPSALGTEQKKMAEAALSALKEVLPSGALKHLHLEFRAGGKIGANAMALPGGVVLVTDEFIELAGSKERIMSVMAHELGHHAHRHMLQKLVQGSLVGVILAMMGGDLASLTTGAASTLLDASYSQELETQADDFAAELLLKLKLEPSLLAEMLSDMDPSGEENEQGFGRYLASHPATSQRIARLRAFGK